jgi:hypothetical protein
MRNTSASVPEPVFSNGKSSAGQCIHNISPSHATWTSFSPSEGLNSPVPGSSFFSAAAPNFLLMFIPVLWTFPFVGRL